jgi:hypothetical protein
MGRDARIFENLRQFEDTPKVGARESQPFAAIGSPINAPPQTTANAIETPLPPAKWSERIDIDALSKNVWPVALFGVVLAILLRVISLITMNDPPSVTLWIGAFCLIPCLLGSLIHLRHNIGKWLGGVILTMIYIAMGTAFFSLFLWEGYDGVRQGGEVAFEVVSFLGLAFFLGILAGVVAGIAGLWNEADKVVRQAEAAAYAQYLAKPKDITLD